MVPMFVEQFGGLAQISAELLKGPCHRTQLSIDRWKSGPSGPRLGDEALVPRCRVGAPLFALFAKGGTRRSQLQTTSHSTSLHQVSSDETKRQGLFKCAPPALRDPRKPSAERWKSGPSGP